MVLNLLDISKSEEGALLPKLASFDLRRMLESTARAMQRRAAERKQKLDLTFEIEDTNPALLFVMAGLDTATQGHGHSRACTNLQERQQK